jgi:hypothetical protein
LQRIKVERRKDREDLFYSFIVSRFTSSFFNFRKDGVYAAIDGTIQNLSLFITVGQYGIIIEQYTFVFSLS